jgi:hypothetical protein
VYFSDFFVLDAPCRIWDLHIGIAVEGDPIQGKDRRPDVEFMSTLNHNVRVHDVEGFRVDEGLYVEVESPWAGEGRMLSRAKFWSGERLVATVEQEGYVRLRKGIKLPGWGGEEKAKI